MNLDGIPGAILLIVILLVAGFGAYFLSGLFGPRKKDNLLGDAPDPTEFEGEQSDTCTDCIE